MSTDVTTYIDDGGHRVSVTYTRAWTQDTCPLCINEACEQAVHSSPTWGADLVVHNQPRAGALH